MNRQYFPVLLLCLVPIALLLPLGFYVAIITLCAALAAYWLSPGIELKQVQILVVLTSLSFILFHTFFWLFAKAVETAEAVQAGDATNWPQVNGFVYFLIPAVALVIFAYATVYAYRTLKQVQ